MALFGLNWEESRWPGHFCSIVLKLPPGKKVPWHRRWAALSSWWKSHFSQKNAFFGQKKAFFQKAHFIQKCSVTLNTVFQCVKNIFFLSQKKIIFFTILNLIMGLTLQLNTFSLMVMVWLHICLQGCWQHRHYRGHWMSDVHSGCFHLFRSRAEIDEMFY